MYSVITVALALSHYGWFTVFTCKDNGPEQRLLQIYLYLGFCITSKDLGRIGKQLDAPVYN